MTDTEFVKMVKTVVIDWWSKNRNEKLEESEVEILHTTKEILHYTAIAETIFDYIYFAVDYSTQTGSVYVQIYEVVDSYYTKRK